MSNTDIKDIKNNIFEGARACLKNFSKMSGDITLNIKTEYFIVVHIANELTKLNEREDGIPFKIVPEARTLEFANSCNRKYNENLEKLGIYEILKRIAINTYRNGRIDIAVYKQTKQGATPSEITPFFPLEIKSINPNKKSVKRDIDRNIQLLNISDTTYGIKQAFAFFISKINNIIYKEDISTTVDNEKDTWEEQLKTWYPNCLDIEFDISAKDIFNNIELSSEDKTSDDYASDAAEQIDLASVEDCSSDNILFIGLLIEIRKKSNPS